LIIISSSSTANDAADAAAPAAADNDNDDYAAIGKYSISIIALHNAFNYASKVLDRNKRNRA
jgi:hypothetical protein